MAAGPLLLLTLGVTLSFLTLVECGVFIVAPNILNANIQETVSVLVTNQAGPTSVTVTVKSNNQVHHSVSKVVSSDEQEILKVRVDGAKLGAPDENGQYYVQLRVQCAGCGNFDRTTDILVNMRTGTVFLQTDKPLYSPGQTVAIQVFALDEARKADNTSIKMEIKNPQGIIILSKKGRTEIGLFSDVFKISNLPLQGLWKIVVHFGTNYTESCEKQIEIKKYVLPHFQVKISKIAEYIDSLDKTIEGSVEARYSFDAEVVGKVRVVFRVVTGGYATYLIDKSYHMRPNEPTKFTLDTENMARLDLNSLLKSKSHLQVEAIVTETSTGISEKVVAPKCPFVTSPYVISFEGTPANFMPGLPFEVKITASYITGTPLARTNLVITATDERNQQVERHGNHDDGRMTNSAGVVSYYFDMRNDIRTIKIKVNVEDDPKVTEYVTQKAVMPGYMKISPHTHSIQPGQTAQFETVLTDNDNFKRLQFMLVSGGRIFDVGQEERPGATVVSFNRHISYNNVPSVRMVAWYFRTDTKELVAASTKLQVERKCKTEVEVKRATSRASVLEPGATCDMIFKGTIGAKVATMVVDKAMYFLNNGSRLTRKTFFDEFESRDLGCAVGGGANATDVFTLAGLTILSDTIKHPPRKSVNCTQSSTGRRKRSTHEEDPDEETCCNTGEQFANTIEIALTSQHRRLACFRGAANFTSRNCKNNFGKCCIERASTRAREVQHHSRTDGQNDENYVEMHMIEKESDVTARTDFRESWLLSSTMKITDSGEIWKTVTIPDSITTWVFQAVTMSTTEGMCVAEPFEQVVRKDLFLKLHLPHTAVLGEQMELAATVYNLGGRKSVRVSFLIEEGLCSNVPVGNYSHQYQHVQAKQSWTARWPIVPTKTGKNTITVKLYSSTTPDIVIRTLNVVPSGDLVVTPILQITQDPSGIKSNQQSWNGTVGSLKYRVQRDTRRQRQITNIPLKLPQDALSDMPVMKVSLLGDVMTPIVEGFLHGTEKHLHKPVGCGEQTMSKLGPLVFTARYLRQQRKLTGELEAATKKKIEDGVRHMLRFRKDNGGFAVHAYPRFEPGLWLTAFALKTITQANEFTDIDNNVIDGANKWLMAQHHVDGMFTRGTGIRYTEDVAGGAWQQLTLTAYIYISLLESGHYQQYQHKINRAMNNLAARSTTETDAYALAIVTYALAKFGHPDAETINQRLLTKAKDLTGQQPVQTYWPTTPSRLSQVGSELEVETAAYGLLAQLTLGRVVQTNSIVEWLLRQRYAAGTFKTTQSTVLSLQALSEYSAVADKDVLDMSCTLSFPQDHQSTSPVFKLDNTNRLVQQTQEVTQHIGHILNIMCQGTGVTHTTVETTYYSSKTQQENCAFNITAQAITRNTTKNEAATIKVCTSLKDATQKLFMPMVEVGLGTGFVPVERTLESLKEQNQSKVDFYEVNDRSVVLYMDEIPSNQTLCLTFDVTREKKVNYTQPVPVKVYAYYEPDKTSCRTFYNPLGEAKGMLDVKCNSAEASCKCLEHQCAPCYGYSVSGYATPPLNTTEELVTRACSQTHKMDYVHAGVVLYSMRGDGELKHTIEIMNVTKPGTESKVNVIGQERVYVVPAKCPWCGLDPGRRFLIMGHDGPNQKDVPVREYKLTPSSYVVPLYNKTESRMQLTREERRVNKIHKNFIKNFKTCGV